jgi:muramoyltetrapeptide carboxypeptidase
LNGTLTIICALLLGTAIVRADSARELIKPRAIQPGDTIALVAPASPASNELVDNAETTLLELGFNVVRKPNVTQRTAYLAGDDETRASTFMEAWLDPEVDAILPVTGGYGAMRILDQLDYEAIRQNPKPMMGFSDITALHLAINKHAGVVTYHGPNIIFLLRRDGIDRSYAQQTAERLLLRHNGIQGASVDSEPFQYDLESISLDTRALVHGRASGRLTGGNLSLVAALMGTPYEIETEGRILFLEDVNEAPYRVDRMLCTLELGGKLDSPAAVILGDFRDRDADEEDENRSTYEAVFDRYFSTRQYPVLVDFPVGHILENAVLPVGVLAEVDTAEPTLRLLESPVASE